MLQGAWSGHQDRYAGTRWISSLLEAIGFQHGATQSNIISYYSIKAQHVDSIHNCVEFGCD